MYGGAGSHDGFRQRWTVVLVFLALVGSPSLATAANVIPGAEFQVNTYTTGHQRNGSVAMDSTGAFVVVWTSFDGQDGDGGGIFGQRYDSAGSPQGGEFAVNTYTTGQQDFARVGSDAAGNFVVVWGGDSGQDGDGFGVFGQRYDSSGVPLGGEFQINTYTTGTQWEPALTFDGGGGFVVVWRDGGTSGDGQDGSRSGVFGQRFDSTGNPLGGEFQVNTTTLGHQYAANVAADAAGNFVVTWTDEDLVFAGSDIVGQRYDSSGTALGAEFVVAVGRSSGVVAQPGGDFVVAWWDLSGPGGSTTGEVFARRYDSSGTAQGPQFQVNTYTVDRQRQPEVALDASGDVVIAWTSAQGDIGMFGRRFDSAGTPTTGEFRVASMEGVGGFVGGLAAGPSGTFVAAYTSPALSDGDGDHPLGGAVFARLFSTCPFDCAACEKCVPDVGCVVAPRDDCLQPTDPFAKAVVDLRDHPVLDKLQWKWVKGESNAWTFGNPDTDTDYSLCLYETVAGSPMLVMDPLVVPAGGTCLSGGADGTNCWKRRGNPPGSKGFKYRDRDLTPDGIEQLRMKPGGGVKGKIAIKGKGANLDMPALGFALPVTVQLQAEDGQCWEARYFPAGVIENDAGRFKAKPGSPSGAFIDGARTLLD
jgi:hypothetical protein